MKLQAMSFLLNDQRIKLIDNVSTEYLSILAILYGDQIEQGLKRVSDYGSMTMLEAENEFRVRTIMMRGQIARKKKMLMDEHKDAERVLMERLKASK